MSEKGLRSMFKTLDHHDHLQENKKIKVLFVYISLESASHTTLLESNQDVLRIDCLY